MKGLGLKTSVGSMSDFHHPVSADNIHNSQSINRQVKGHPPIGGLSQQWLTQELAIFDNLPLVVELGGERGPVGINILAI